MANDDVLVLTRPADGIALLTLNRPAKRNALSVELREAGCRALAVLADDESVRSLVVTGAGVVFFKFLSCWSVSLARFFFLCQIHCFYTH